MPVEQATSAGGDLLPTMVAVIIACHNYAGFVGRAIASVLDQQDGCELVVVDDGSTDESWSVIARSGARAYRVPNGGQRSACLYGLARTRAPFVLFLDADDELAPGAVRTILGVLDPAVAKVQFPLTQIDADGRPLGRTHPTLRRFRARETLIREVLATGVYTSPPTSGNVFRRDLCELLQDAAYDRAVDGVILFAAPFLGDVVSLAEPLARYRIHDRNDSGVGRLPSASLLRRDAARFLDRMAHLRQLPCVQRQGGLLVQPETTFYYRQLGLTIAVIAGQGGTLRLLPGVLAAVAGAPMPTARKVVFATFLTLLAVLPSRAATALIAYRAAGGARATSARRGVGTLFRAIRVGAPREPAPS